MAQFGRPSADTYNSDGWTDESAGSTNIYTHIDEAIESDSDYIRSALTPTSDPYVTKLTTIEDPLSSLNHIVRCAYGKDASGGDQIDLTIQLREGYTNEGSPGTLIATVATLTNIASGWNLISPYTLSSGEADSITDYSSLYLRFLANKP